jgi:hypothetical protein
MHATNHGRHPLRHRRPERLPAEPADDSEGVRQSQSASELAPPGPVIVIQNETPGVFPAFV